MEPSVYTSALFVVTTAFTTWFFFKAAKNSGLALIVMLAIAAVQAALAFNDFFQDTRTMPPKIALAPGICVLIIVLLFLLKQGRTFLSNLDMKWLIWLHLVRVPVEIGLYLLYRQGTVPELMTFEGSNPDILSGITAPIAVWLLYNKGNIKRWGLLMWNLICLGLLVNIVVRAVLSVPTPIQKFAFDQPNTAVLEFPYVWLPGIIVPLVLLAHLAVIRQIVLKKA